MKYWDYRWGIRPFRPWLLAFTAIALVFLLENTSEAKQKYTIIYVSKEDHDSKDEFSQKLEVLKVMRKSTKDTYKTMIFSPGDQKLAESFYEFLSKQDEKATPPKTPGDFLMVKGHRYFYNTTYSSESFYLDTQAIASDNYHPIITSMVSENIKGWNQLSEDQYETYKKALLRDPKLQTYFVLPDITAEYELVKVSSLENLKPSFIAFVESHGFSKLHLRKAEDSFLVMSGSNRSLNLPRYQVTGKVKKEIPAGLKSITLDLERLANSKELKRYKCKPCTDQSMDKISITGHGVAGNMHYLAIHLSLFGFDWERGSSGCFCPNKVSRKDSVPRLILIEKSKDKHSKDVIVERWITYKSRIVEWVGEF